MQSPTPVPVLTSLVRAERNHIYQHHMFVGFSFVIVFVYSFLACTSKWGFIRNNTHPPFTHTLVPFTHAALLCLIRLFMAIFIMTQRILKQNKEDPPTVPPTTTRHTHTHHTLPHTHHTQHTQHTHNYTHTHTTHTHTHKTLTEQQQNHTLKLLNCIYKCAYSLIPTGLSCSIFTLLFLHHARIEKQQHPLIQFMRGLLYV